jgi:TP53 regulating kinase-like protein
MTRILRIGHYHSKLLLYGKIRLLFLISGISTPTVYFTNMENSTIYMEEITDSQTVREYIQHVQATEDSDSVNSILKPLGETIGAVLGKLHMNNIVHGDLTTSNMLLRGLPADLDLFLIDFGLSHFENFAEEKGVDLYVLERAILSTHPNTEDLFQTILDNYMKYNKKGAPEVIAKLDEVRLRGRKRTMVG